MKKGILVGMGTDAYTHDMLESLKVFLIIQRHNAEMPNVAWGEDMKMLFENNREIAGRYFKKPVGSSWTMIHLPRSQMRTSMVICCSA